MRVEVGLKYKVFILLVSDESNGFGLVFLLVFISSCCFNVIMRELLKFVFRVFYKGLVIFEVVCSGNKIVGF